MSHPAAESARRRRSGAELESALLDAAWEELVQTGYARMTMNSVAVRAGTSEPVLYRRWPNKDQLVLAALTRRRDANPAQTEDAGSLRDDLVAELTAAGRTFAGFYAIAGAAAFSGLLADTGLTPAEVREQLMHADTVPTTRPVYRRAVARGEIDLARIPLVVLETPFDLVRHDLLMTLEAPGPDRIRAIVDDVTMPAIAAYAPPRQRGRSSASFR